jgi:hypothetical protein
MRRDQPGTLSAPDFHDAVNRMDELIGTVRVIVDEVFGRVIVGQRSYGDSWLRVVFRQETALSQSRYIMTRMRSCDIPRQGG